MPPWSPRARELTLAWGAGLLPRLAAVVALWSQVSLSTSSTAVVNGVLTSDLQTPMWPPLYQVFAVVAWRVSAGWAPAFMALHLAAHALVGVGVLLLAARLGLRRRTGWIAVAVSALLPYLVIASARHIDLGVYVSVAVLASAAMARANARAGWWAGAWFLIRPESLVTIIGLGLWWWWSTDTGGRRRLRHAAIVFVAVLLAWSTADAVRFGRFTPLPSNAGQNLYVGHRPGVAARLADRSFNPQSDPDVFDPAIERGESPYAIDAAAARLALRHIRDDPAGALVLVALKFARYWDWTLGNNPPHSRVEALAYTVPYVAILVFVPAGIWQLWRTGQCRALSFLAIVIVGYTLPHVVVFGLIRMRMTVEWALILVGAAAAGELRLSPPHAVGSTTRLAR